jgi:hypothetical protein
MYQWAYVCTYQVTFEGKPNSESRCLYLQSGAAYASAPTTGEFSNFHDSFKHRTPGAETPRPGCSQVVEESQWSCFISWLLKEPQIEQNLH